MPKKMDKTIVSISTPEEAMEVVSGVSTTQTKRPDSGPGLGFGVSAASDTNIPNKSMLASNSSDLEDRLSRMEANVYKMASLFTSHFGNYDEDPEDQEDATPYGGLAYQECGSLPGQFQDGGDAPQPGGS